MSEIFAEQLTAVATAVLALFAFVTARYARKAFDKQLAATRSRHEIFPETGSARARDTYSALRS